MKNLYFVTVFITLLCLAACNPAKQIARQQDNFNKVMDEYIKSHPLRVDTVTKFLPGADSSEIFRVQADSFRALHLKHFDSVKTIYKDTCKTAADRYSEGFDYGYKVGSTSATHYVHDTIVTTVYPTAEIQSLQRKINDANQQVQAEKLNYEKEKKFRWITYSLLALILILILLFITSKLRLL